MNQVKEWLKKISVSNVVFVIQVCISVYIMGSMIALNVVPMKYQAVALVVFVLLNVGMYFFMKRNSNRTSSKIRQGIAIGLSVLMSVLFVFGGFYMNQTSHLIQMISDTNTETRVYSLYVKKDSKYSSIKDVKSLRVGVVTSVDKNNIERAVGELKNTVRGVSLLRMNEFSALVDLFYQDEVEVILISDAYAPILKQYKASFMKDSKVLYTFKIKEQGKDIAKKVEVSQQPFTVYLSGIDVSGSVDTVSRSDVNMIVSVNPKTRKILMTSIPRDYYVTIASHGKKDKLTHAGMEGIENSVKTLEKLLGIDINYYAKVNFTTLTKMVDVLGGVRVYSPYSFVTLHGNYAIHEGINHMDGEKALGFVRERYSLPNGDNDRVHNQQLLLQGMIDKALSPAIISNYVNVLKTIEDCFETNMSYKEITDLIKMQLQRGGEWTVLQKQLSGSGSMMYGGAYMPDTQLYYMIPEEASIKENVDFIKGVLQVEK